MRIEIGDIAAQGDGAWVPLVDGSGLFVLEMGASRGTTFDIAAWNAGTDRLFAQLRATVDGTEVGHASLANVRLGASGDGDPEVGLASAFMLLDADVAGGSYEGVAMTIEWSAALAPATDSAVPGAVGASVNVVGTQTAE